MSISDYNMMTVGKANFTLANDKHRWTYQINQSKDGRCYFVSVLSGADINADYAYLGIFKPESGSVSLTKASRFTPESMPFRAVAWLVQTLKKGEPLTHNFELKWADQCQRCGRTLTVPSSIDSRIGPECAKKV
jgi:hypothetical protein